MDKKIEDELQKQTTVEKIFEGAFNYCLNVMRNESDLTNVIALHWINDPVSKQSVDYGKELVDFVLELFARIRKTVIDSEDDDLERPFFYQQKLIKEFFDLNKKINIGGIKSSDIFGESDSNCSSTSTPEILAFNRFNETQMRTSKTRKFTPYEEKVKVVEIARKNPSWSIERIREQTGCKNLLHKLQLAKWKDLVNHGGPKFEKIKIINKIVYEKYCEAERNNQITSGELIKKWALEAKKIHFQQISSMDFEFHADDQWLENFEKFYKLSGRFCSKGNSKPKHKMRIPVEKKKIAVELAIKHPTWALKKISQRSGLKDKIRTWQVLRRWAHQLKKGVVENPLMVPSKNNSEKRIVDEQPLPLSEENKKPSDYVKVYNLDEDTEMIVEEKQNIKKEKPLNLSMKYNRNEQNNNEEMIVEENNLKTLEENYQDSRKDSLQNSAETTKPLSSEDIKIVSVRSLAAPGSEAQFVNGEFIEINHNNVLSNENMKISNVVSVHPIYIKQMLDLDIMNSGVTVENNFIIIE